MKITKKWLNEKDACTEGVTWFKKQTETDAITIAKKLIKINKREELKWANWLITKLFNREQKIQYSVFAAKQVLPFFVKVYPKDKRLHQAIRSAEDCIKNTSAKAKNAAESAARSAWSAARSAARSAAWSAAESAARSAAESAAWSAAESAAWSAASAAESAESAAESAVSAAESAVSAASAEYKSMLKKILNYGIKLLETK